MAGTANSIATMLTLLLLSACASGPGDIGARFLVGDARADNISAAPERVQRRFDLGLQAMQVSSWEDALPAMEELWDDYPQYSGPPLNAALIYQRTDRPEEAEQWFQRALDSNAGNLDARNAYAVFLREQGRYDDALNEYQVALEFGPDHALTHYNLGILYDLYLGEKAFALEHFSRYQELTAGESRQVDGWIADLQRQLAHSSTYDGSTS